MIENKYPQDTESEDSHLIIVLEGKKEYTFAEKIELIIYCEARGYSADNYDRFSTCFLFFPADATIYYPDRLVAELLVFNNKPGDFLDRIFYEDFFTSNEFYYCVWCFFNGFDPVCIQNDFFTIEFCNFYHDCPHFIYRSVVSSTVIYKND